MQVLRSGLSELEEFDKEIAGAQVAERHSNTVYIFKFLAHMQTLYYFQLLNQFLALYL